MRADELVSRLQKVRSTGPYKWMACCPAHPDKTASLSVKCCDDGRVLLHCFAGCQPDDILGAVGLEFSHLFPEKLGHHMPPQRRQISASDALHMMGSEITLISIVASDLLQHREIDETTWKRFARAVARVNELRSATE
jgi:DNA primase